jgi:putative SOS response-associated peptidase YedK
MCGRYVITSPLEAIQDLFRVSERPNLKPRYNAAPTQTLPIVRLDEEGARHLVTARWGLIPFWAKDASIANKLINARAETVTDKNAFRDSYNKRRCLIPADGFFEWQKVDGGKQPYRIGLEDWALFAFAGLWSDWTDPESEERVESFTIITTEANDLVAPLHNRMPVIVPPDDHAHWLDTGQDGQPLLKPFPADGMQAVPVDKRVGNPKNDDPGVIEPVAQQGNLL